MGGSASALHAEEALRAPGPAAPLRHHASDAGDSQLNAGATFVSIKLVGTTYNIPSAYFLRTGVNTSILGVSYPGLNPLSDQTKDCVDRASEGGAACTALEIRLTNSAPTLTNEARLNTFVKNPKAVHVTDVHPFGYDLYVTGGSGARVELYTNPREKILFYCDIISVDPEIGVCQDDVRLKDGNSAKVFFNSTVVGKVADIEAGLRSLMAGFVVGASEK